MNIATEGLSQTQKVACSLSRRMLWSVVSEAADKSNGERVEISALQQALSNVKKCSFSTMTVAVGRLIPLKEVFPRDMINKRLSVDSDCISLRPNTV